MPETTEAAPTQEQQQAAQPEYVSLLSGLKVIKPGESTEKPPEQAAQEFKPTEEKPPEEPKSEVTDEINPEKSMVEQIKVGNREPKSEKAQENFKTLQESRNQERKAREEAEARLKEWEQKYGARDKEFQELQTKLQQSPQIPENFQQEFQRQQQLIQELQTNLRAASIERDPEFVAKYQTGRQHQVNRLKELASLAGMPEGDFQQALKHGQEDRLSDIRDSLSPQDRYKWDSIRTNIAGLDIEKEEAIQNSSKTWEQLQKAREEQFHQQKQAHVQQMLGVAQKVKENYWSTIPILKENPELANQVEATLTALAGGPGTERMTPENIMGRAALVEILHFRDQQREPILQGLMKENEDLKKKLEESEKFIKSRHGGTGESYSTSRPVGEGEWDPNLPPSQQIRVRTS